MVGKAGKKKESRTSWDEYFMGIMKAVSKRATCNRGRSGCVVVKGKKIITTGYTGSPAGMQHCDEVGHEVHEVINLDGTKSKHCIRTSHSEENALIQAARFGISVDGAIMYANMEPCYTCAKMIINAGIKRVVCNKKYHRAQRTREVFKEAGVKLVVVNSVEEDYPDKK